MVRCVLGIDLGTSSLKAVLLREDGTVVGSATRSYPIDVPQPGWAEQDPEQWWGAACAATRALLEQAAAPPGQVVAICAGGQMHGTVLLDREGGLVRPAIIWPDQRAGQEAGEADAALQDAALLPRLGGGVSPGFMLASLLWCRRHEPDRWTRVATALLPKDYLRYRLTGIPASEPSDGTGIPAIDLFEVTSGTSFAPADPAVPGGMAADHPWCLPALRALDLPAGIFPPLLASAAPAGAITPEAAAATGLRTGTPVLCGGSDQAMAAVGAGLLAPGTLLISISTGGQLVTPLHAPLPDPRQGLRTLCHALPRTYLALAATLGAGLSLRWLREEVLDDRAPDADVRLMDQAATAPPGAGGLLFLPYLAGERAPLLDPATSGAFIGLRLDHGRPHLARAVLEGIAFSLRHAMEPLEQAGVHPTTIILAGGAAQSPVMRRIMADVLGRPVASLETAEQSALGAALLAAQHAGFFPTLQAACDAVVRYGPPVEPSPRYTALYEELFVQYRGLYPALRDTTHALRRLGATR
ncbi:MAG TPA: FGGY family carbohydrate kinase [Chloroflexota bacterium]|nr:FGGY family carbohydrate kinase [Chloroflexota bacterium]